MAIYALNHELARVGETATQPLTGEIRLAWWRDRIADLAQGREAPGQPVLQALAEPIRAGRLPHAVLEALVEARHADLEPTPFADDAALLAYVDGTAGAVMALAARALAEAAPLTAVISAGRAWGLAGLYRARSVWRARDRSWVPKSWGLDDDAALRTRVDAEVRAALQAARVEAGALPVAAFPAIAYAGLARAYATDRAPGELWRRAKLVVSTATGRI